MELKTFELQVLVRVFATVKVLATSEKGARCRAQACTFLFERASDATAAYSLLSKARFVDHDYIANVIKDPPHPATLDLQAITISAKPEKKGGSKA